MKGKNMEDAIVVALPLITGISIYVLTEPKTADTAICAIAWTLLWWFVLAIGRALERFSP